VLALACCKASELGRGAASRCGDHPRWDPGEKCARADSRLLSRGERLRERLDINDVIREVIALSEGELRRNAISLQTGIRRGLALSILSPPNQVAHEE
jgi:hypothetical protein